MMTFEQKIRIRDIKQELTDTDYHILKIQELIYVGSPIPEKYKEIVQHRVELRRELNEIEESIR